VSGQYRVQRVDGQDWPGLPHHRCRLLVVDLDHDPDGSLIEGFVALLRLRRQAASRQGDSLEQDIDPRVQELIDEQNRHIQEHAQKDDSK
jgi:hypothetical protein